MICPNSGRIDGLAQIRDGLSVAFEVPVLHVDARLVRGQRRERISTSVTNAGSNCQLAVICQASTRRCGGSERSTVPISHSEPSSHTEYQRPPAFCSRIPKPVQAFAHRLHRYTSVKYTSVKRPKRESRPRLRAAVPGSRSVTDEARDPTSTEPEIDLPPGLELERLGPGEERVRVRYTLGNRMLIALPRIVLFVSVVFALAQAWRHHVFIAFWLFGLPFLRWLSGPARGSLLIGPQRLELEGARLFGGSFVLPRARIAQISVARGSPFQFFQRAIQVRTVDEQSARLLVGLSAAQAEFVNRGLLRWLSES